MADVVSNNDGMNKFNRMLRAATEQIGAPTNPHRIMLRRWAARYATFTRRRFIKLSRGGGDATGGWPGLKASTKRRRRKARPGSKGTRQFSTLIDTNQLSRAIEPGQDGNFLQDVGGGINIGFAAVPKRVRSGKRPSATLGEIASFHHFGKGNLPKRPILVDVDDNTRRQMLGDARVAGLKIERLLGP